MRTKTKQTCRACGRPCLPESEGFCTDCHTDRLRHRCTDWNRKHPIGSEVILTRYDGQEVQTTTRTTVQIAGGRAVLKVRGLDALYTLDRVRLAER